MRRNRADRVWRVVSALTIGASIGGAAGCANDEAPPPAVDAGTGANGCSTRPATGVTGQSPALRDADLLVRAAVVVGSCIEDDGITRNLGYMWNEDLEPDDFFYRTARQAACLAGARCGCEAVRACLGFSMTRGDAGSCTPCNGSVFNVCAPGYRATIDCQTIGLSCDPAAMCASAPATGCDPTTFVPSCDANGRPLSCQRNDDDNTIARGPVCASLGLECAAGRCTGSGAACQDAIFSPRDVVNLQGLACVGNDLEACVGGRRATIRCADRGPGFECRNVGERYFCGLAAECAPSAEGATVPGYDAHCEGNQIVVCNAGRIDKVDCTSLGFTTCEIDKSAGKYGCVPGPRY